MDVGFITPHRTNPIVWRISHGVYMMLSVHAPRYAR